MNKNAAASRLWSCALMTTLCAQFLSALPIAIQNLFENLRMLVFESAYAGVTGAGVPINIIALGFGLMVAVSMAVLTATRLKRE